jgi:Tol biopolymer transport system component
MKLGPYEILSPLGAGGLGEVYRAKDSRLGREVAIKVLPESTAKDPEALARFEREAKAVAALSHPNILALHDVGTENGVVFAVMELLEGESLRGRLQGGPLPARRVLDWGREIAGGLAAAHEKGIIHRDLKPENLFITADNRVKILDFGLARQAPVQTPSAMAQENTPTKSVGTGPGVVMGTAGYMSPEQVRGEIADHRADIFSLGAVLYEMASGRRAFKGDSAVETMNAVLKSEPPETEGTLTGIGLGLERIIRHCLEKNPSARYQSARDLAFQIAALTDISASGASGIRPGRGSRGRRWRERLAWPVALLALFIAGLALLAYRKTARARPVMRTFITPPEKARFNFFGDDGGTVVISPDERTLAFVATDNAGISSIWLRPVDQLSAYSLHGSEGANHPFWSPDSHSLGYFAGGKLKRMDLNGGAATVLCDARAGRGGSWSTKGMILFSSDLRTGLLLVPAAGGAVQWVTKVDPARHTSHRWPLFMPDGDHFLYLAINHDTLQAAEDGLYFAALSGGEPVRVTSSESHAAWAAGRLLFQHEGTLTAQAFDPVKGVLSGEAAPVGEKIRYDPSVWQGVFDARGDGLLVYRSGGSTNESRLTWFDRNGKALGVVGDMDKYSDLRLSPDGRQLAVAINIPSDLWVINLARGTKSRLTFTPGMERPLWTADTRQVVYSSCDPATGHSRIYRRQADGSGVEETLLADEQCMGAMELSPDGKTLIYMKLTSAVAKPDLWALPLTGERKPFVLLDSPFIEADAQLSPDGRYLAYMSDESGRYEVYIVPFNPAAPGHPVAGGKWQISITGGFEPRWRKDGRELFFTNLNGQIMAVSLSVKSGAIEPETPHALFTVSNSKSVDVSADGQRFLIAAPNDDDSSPLTLVTNWDAEYPNR